jgi:hypothetical protein
MTAASGGVSGCASLLYEFVRAGFAAAHGRAGKAAAATAFAPVITDFFPQFGSFLAKHLLIAGDLVAAVHRTDRLPALELPRRSRMSTGQS